MCLSAEKTKMSDNAPTLGTNPKLPNEKYKVKKVEGRGSGVEGRGSRVVGRGVVGVEGVIVLSSNI